MRRSDSQDFAGRLADRLRATPAVTRLFIDVDGIVPGEDFPAKLTAALDESDVCMVVIGPRWTGQRENAPPRVFDADDFVRREVRAALETGRRALPVLANGAIMPSAGDLPEDLAGLVELNAISVRHGDFDRDVDHLIDVMLERRKPGAVRAYLNRHPIQYGTLRGLGGVLVAMFALIIGAAIHYKITGGQGLVSNWGEAYLLAAGLAIAGALLSIVYGAPRRRSARRNG